jgi:hypothetical protein
MAFGPFRGLPGVEAQRAMGHAHLVFFGSRRLLRSGTRTARHLLALHRTLYYNDDAPDDLLRDRRYKGLRADGSARGPYLWWRRSCGTVQN